MSATPTGLLFPSAFGLLGVILSLHFLGLSFDTTLHWLIGIDRDVLKKVLTHAKKKLYPRSKMQAVGRQMTIIRIIVVAAYAAILILLTEVIGFDHRTEVSIAVAFLVSGMIYGVHRYHHRFYREGKHLDGRMEEAINSLNGRESLSSDEKDGDVVKFLSKCRLLVSSMMLSVVRHCLHERIELANSDLQLFSEVFRTIESRFHHEEVDFIRNTYYEYEAKTARCETTAARWLKHFLGRSDTTPTDLTLVVLRSVVIDHPLVPEISINEISEARAEGDLASSQPVPLGGYTLGFLFIELEAVSRGQRGFNRREDPRRAVASPYTIYLTDEIVDRQSKSTIEGKKVRCRVHCESKNGLGVWVRKAHLEEWERSRKQASSPPSTQQSRSSAGKKGRRRKDDVSVPSRGTSMTATIAKSDEHAVIPGFENLKVIYRVPKCSRGLLFLRRKGYWVGIRRLPDRES